MIAGKPALIGNVQKSIYNFTIPSYGDVVNFFLRLT